MAACESEMFDLHSMWVYVCVRVCERESKVIESLHILQ